MMETRSFLHVVWAESQPQRYERLKAVVRRRKDGMPDLRYNDGRFVDQFERVGPVGIFA